MNQEGERQYSLPPSVATQSDLRRLIAELEAIDNILTSDEIRQRTGHATIGHMTLSEQLGDFIELNQCPVDDDHQRSELLGSLRQLKDRAPVIHMTFATTAEREVLSKIVAWLREKVNPQAVISVGLQPELIGGAYIRTTNKVFDMSIRSQLANGRSIIVKELEAVHGNER